MEKLEQLIQKAKTGGLTPDEMIYLELLVIELQYRKPEELSVQERRLLQIYRNHMSGKGRKIYTEEELEQRKDRAFAKTATQLDLYTTEPGEEQTRLPAIPGRSVRRKRLMPAFIGAAATIALLFTIFWITGNTGNKVYYAHGATTEFRLPDSTLVVMNSGSEMTVPRRFNKEKRNVEIKGEVFFNVTHNKEKPFIIRHGALTTEVKGTSFTICDYPELNDNKVTVNTGLVRVSAGGRELAYLTANSQLAYNKASGKYEVTLINAVMHSRWMQGDLILHEAGLEELTFRMKQHFGKELIVKDNAFGNRVSITGDFAAGMKPEQVMESFVLIYGIRYRIDSSSIVVYK